MKLLLSIAIITCAHVVSGQSIFRGKVIDSKTKLPLSRATVKVKAQNIESSSGSDGMVEFYAELSKWRNNIPEIL